MDGPTLDLRFVGEPDFVAALDAEFSSSEEVAVIERRAVDDATELRLDLGTVSEIVSTVSALFFNGAMVPALLRVISKTHPQRIKVSSPFGEFTFEPSEQMSEEELRAILRTLADI